MITSNAAASSTAATRKISTRITVIHGLGPGYKGAGIRPEHGESGLEAYRMAKGKNLALEEDLIGGTHLGLC